MTFLVCATHDVMVEMFLWHAQLTMLWWWCFHVLCVILSWFMLVELPQILQVNVLLIVDSFFQNPHRIMHVLDQMGDLALHSVDIYTRIASNSRCEEDYSQLEVWCVEVCWGGTCTSVDESVELVDVIISDLPS